MRTQLFGAETTAAEIRALTPGARDVEEDVRTIVDAVRRDGDGALLDFIKRFDSAAIGDDLMVSRTEMAEAEALVDVEVLGAIHAARSNVRKVAEAQVHAPLHIELPAGQVVEYDEVPIRRAAAYIPGGRAPYPSTVVMTAEVARVAGVEELAICTPPGPDGKVHPAILAACHLCKVKELYRMGGAHSIAALAYGTYRVRRVDLIVGPGNAWVQEAKRQVNGDVGIDGINGPSELVVVAAHGADPELVALDLLAQGEHGEDSLVVAISPEGDLLRAIGDAVTSLAADRPTVAAAVCALVETEDVRQGVDLANAIAPEHVELIGNQAEVYAHTIKSAGCVYVGQDGATAFGDYVAGSNHVLPTGGAARFASGLGVSTFRRRMARVSFPPGAAGRLAPDGAALARAEGFPVHGESMERRGT